MGWIGHELPDRYRLYTRGGFQSVFISHEDRPELEITIPESILRKLAAGHIRTERIIRLEAANDEEILWGE